MIGAQYFDGELANNSDVDFKRAVYGAAYEYSFAKNVIAYVAVNLQRRFGRRFQGRRCLRQGHGPGLPGHELPVLTMNHQGGRGLHLNAPSTGPLSSDRGPFPRVIGTGQFNG